MNSAINEERYEFVLWLYRLRAQSNGHLGLFQPDFIYVIFRPMMPSKYHRSDGDIMESVDLWCDDPTTAEARYGHISNWDTSLVTTMKNLFNGDQYSGGKVNRSTFNEDISQWNVSAVTTMECMFSDASVFNGDISRWNVSAVTTMKNIFYGCPIVDDNKPKFTP
jgi:surface protein